ncbi:hypothetical protein B0H10DRAFT_1941967 [Mycena sp. CBHHK59/15]|nr:hypothetical protein B0H10DRAFT_1941967 [Mycena sp. CBHHK59/15]
MNVRCARKERLGLSSFRRLGLAQLLGLLNVKFKNVAQIFVEVVVGGGTRIELVIAQICRPSRIEFVAFFLGQKRLDKQVSDGLRLENDAVRIILIGSGGGFGDGIEFGDAWGRRLGRIGFIGFFLVQNHVNDQISDGLGLGIGEGVEVADIIQLVLTGRGDDLGGRNGLYCTLHANGMIESQSDSESGLEMGWEEEKLSWISSTSTQVYLERK